MYTEKDLILHAKSYIDKLSEGINPLNDLNINETDIVSEEKIKTCFKYISKWLFEYHQLLNEPKKTATVEVYKTANPNKNTKETFSTQNSTPIKIQLKQTSISKIKSCDTCKHYRGGNCSGIKLCDDYEYAPTFTTEETSLWPKEGDATYFKRTGKSRN